MLLALVFAALQTAAVPVCSPPPSRAPRLDLSAGGGFSQTALPVEARRDALAGRPRIGI